MACNMKSILGIVCLVLQFLVFLFVIVATPVDVLRGPKSPWRTCFSMWGLKRCGNHKVVSSKGWKGFPCKSARDTMNAAAAFAIFSIFLTLIGLILTAVGFFGLLKLPNVLTIIVCAIAFFTILVSWACIAGARDDKCGFDYKPLGSFDLYGGFGLLVTAWILELVVCILTFFA